MRQRLDEALVARGLYASRARARDAILRGTVLVNDAAAKKPSQPIAAADSITAADAAQAYVSRAALKLVHALDHFNVSPAGWQCLDLGASTGGFSQVLLERGAAQVTAIDVGHGQMKVQDPRLTSRECVNARDLVAADVPQNVRLITCDVSFIALHLALAPALALASPGCTLVALIKPQFELGRNALGKTGVVKDEAAQKQACTNVAEFIAQAGWHVLGLTASPIIGGDGNREFLIAARKT